MQTNEPVGIGPSLQVIVYERILEAIVRLDLAPSARLVEGRLAAQLGVSRVPVREALRQLEREQLVVVHPRRGATVASLTSRDADEVYTLRITLEALAARLAAENASGEQIRAIEEALRRQADCVSGNTTAQDVESFYAWGAKFHSQVVIAGDNEKLVALLRVISHHVARLRVIQSRLTSPEIMQLSLASHAEIFQAIAHRMGPEAQQLMEEHVRRSRQRIVPQLDKVNGLVPDDGTARRADILGRGSLSLGESSNADRSEVNLAEPTLD